MVYHHRSLSKYILRRNYTLKDNYIFCLLEEEKKKILRV